jgi:pyrroline-5-carboxylate reductase
VGSFQSQGVFFLGAGSIGEAMISGMLASQLLTPQKITISNRKKPERLQMLHDRYGVCISQDKKSDIQRSDIVILAIKPFDIVAALREIAPAIDAHHLIISVVAGASTQVIEESLPVSVPVIRAMPNTSSIVQASATAISPGRWATPSSVAMAKELFAAMGICSVVDESLLPAVTGLSGTGPAYIYYIVEALLEAGLLCGLDKVTCQELLLQTVFGAGKMLQDTGRDPAELRRQVTSPRGTTMAAMDVLDQAGIKHVIIQAVQRATQRALEMAEEITYELNKQ